MAAPEKINRTNYMKYNPDPDDGQHVKAGFWNNLITWLLAMFPSLGSANIDTVSEYTSGSGVTVDDVLIKDGSITVDTLTEKTSGSGVVIDGLTIKDGKSGITNTVTANATGVLGAIIASYEQHVVIVSSSADHIVSLPLLSSVPTGTNISGTLKNTGCELRVNPTDMTGTKYINGVTGGNELKINGGTGVAYFEAVKQTYARWVVKTWSSLGAPTTIVPDF